VLTSARPAGAIFRAAAVQFEKQFPVDAGAGVHGDVLGEYMGHIHIAEYCSGFCHHDFVVTGTRGVLGGGCHLACFDHCEPPAPKAVFGPSVKIIAWWQGVPFLVVAGAQVRTFPDQRRRAICMNAHDLPSS
jgi:hypothetical protein